MGDEKRVQLAAEAFVYGFPLVFDLEEVERFSKVGMGGLAAAPLNVFAHATALAGPAETFVSIDNDTVYSIAQVDVGTGPARFEVPDTGGRYYVMQPTDPKARANWLPTPAGSFRPLLRIYEPEEADFDGGYELPPITAA